MKHSLYSYSRINPALTQVPRIPIMNDFFERPASTNLQEGLIELAARLCYASTAKMYQAPAFIRARMKEGHLDVIEHVFLSVKLESVDISLHDVLWHSPHMRLLPLPGYSSTTPCREGILTGNLRAWRDLFASRIGGFFFGLQQRVAASFQQVFYDTPSMQTPPAPISFIEKWIPQTAIRGATVALLAASTPLQFIKLAEDETGAATFYLDGVSRSLTHQLVRHRLFSISQESQRYVNLEKGNWRAVIPPAIAGDSQAAEIMSETYRQTEEAYAKLLSLGIRKEDARFLLPNATETRLIVSASFRAWQHFLNLRATDKAAQWEIAGVAQAILMQLYQLAPGTFHEQMEAYRKLPSAYQFIKTGDNT